MILQGLWKLSHFLSCHVTNEQITRICVSSITASLCTCTAPERHSYPITPTTTEKCAAEYQVLFKPSHQWIFKDLPKVIVQMVGLVVFCCQDAAKRLHVGYIHEDSLKERYADQNGKTFVMIWDFIPWSFCLSLTDVVSNSVAESHVRVQAVWGEQLVVLQLWSEEAGLHQVHVGHIRDIPHTPKRKQHTLS